MDTNTKPQEINPLLQIVDSLPLSTSECERVFSAMNDIQKERNALLVTRTGGLVFIKSVGPPVLKFNPLPYVQSWLRSGRSAEKTECRKESPFQNVSMMQCGSYSIDYDIELRLLL